MPHHDPTAGFSMKKTAEPAANHSLPAFQQYQYEFAQHIRNPRLNKRPRGVEARRMKVYNELLYNNLEGFLLACFPVLHKVLGKRKWGKLVRDFFTVHRCHTPFFKQIPDEFLQYLNTERGEQDDDPCFMQDLAHYEWVELMLSVSNKQISAALIDTHGDLMQGQPALNPVLSLQTYRYPVHKISPRFQPSPEQKEETHFAILRKMDDEIKFILLNQVSMRLLQLLQSSSMSGTEILLKIAEEMKHSDPNVILAGGLQIFQQLRESEVIFGTWKSGAAKI